MTIFYIIFYYEKIQIFITPGACAFQIYLYVVLDTKCMHVNTKRYIKKKQD